MRATPAAEPRNALCTPGTIIDRIEIERISVFDPASVGEDRRLFRVVNAIHRPMLSRESTVRALLTIRAGQSCDPVALDEAERTLRSFNIFQDAWVDAVARDGEKVLVRVRVRDAWSTRVRFSFSSQGGANRSVFKLLENNLFGSGYNLAWSKKKDQDRDETDFEFVMPHLAGRRWRLAALYGDTSDGKNRSFSLTHPFWRFKTRHFFDASWNDRRFKQKIFAAVAGETEEVDAWQLDDEEARLAYGYSPKGLTHGTVTRYFVNFERRRRTASLHPEDRCFAVPKPPRGTPCPIDRPDLAPTTIDQDKLGIGYSWDRIDFRRVAFYESARRIEDFELGDQLRLDLALAIPGVSHQRGGDLTFEYRFGFDLGGGHLARLRSRVEAALRDGDWFDTIAEVEAQSWWKLSTLNTIYASGRLSFGHDTQGPRRFLLGGDTGLRGYRSRAFAGDHQLLLVAEHRYFAPWELFHLFRVGLVGFAEVGGAWDAGGGFGWDDLHPDVGLGLRFELLRSAAGTTVQLNAAYPLDPNGDPREGQGLQFSVLTSKGF